jgi:hypothetical protein
LFNLTESPIEESISIEDYSSAHDLFGAALSVDSNRVNLAVDPMEVRCIVLAR